MHTDLCGSVPNVLMEQISYLTKNTMCAVRSVGWFWVPIISWHLFFIRAVMATIRKRTHTLRRRKDGSFPVEPPRLLTAEEILTRTWCTYWKGFHSGMVKSLLYLILYGRLLKLKLMRCFRGRVRCSSCVQETSSDYSDL